MKALVLAGGSGTRLWPLSRGGYPKQFLKLQGNRSLLQQTVERLLKIVRPEDLIIITCEKYKFHVKTHLSGLEGYHLLLEPLGRNTAPAIAYGLCYAKEHLGVGPEETFLVCPSDHVINPEEDFVKTVKAAEQIAQKGYLVTFGLTPSHPETGYGYIKAGDKLDGAEINAYKVDRFTEKPDLKTAQSYLAEGGYFWNAGIFLFCLESAEREIRQQAPEIYALYEQGFAKLHQNFAQMPEISIDYAIMERSKKVATVPLNLTWNDIGSWDALFALMEKDEQGNVKRGRIVSFDTQDTMIMGDKRLITTIGIKDLLVVETPDALLLVKKGQTQAVSKLVQYLKAHNYPEAEEHVITYRPWGSYTVLEEGPRYKIKRIVVNPGASLSLQMHYHRSEHWVVVRGTARVTIGDKEHFLHENESVFVPKSTKHRLENPGKIPLEIIEVQNGEYLGEDDIVRFEDVYGREES